MLLIRMALVALVLLSIAYWLVSVYSRSVRRERLEREWEEDQRRGKDAGGRDDFLRRGLRRYDQSLRKRLIWLVYILPILAIGATIYAVNVQ